MKDWHEQGFNYGHEQDEVTPNPWLCFGALAICIACVVTFGLILGGVL